MLSCLQFLFVATPLLAVPQDRIVTVDGERIGGKVETATLEQVSYQDSGGGSQSLEGRQVLEIQFGNKPEALMQAEDFSRNQDFQNAVNSFDAAASAGGAAWVKPLAELGKAQAYLAWAEIDNNRAKDAVDAFSTWTAAYPDDFHIVAARTGLARATAMTGKTDDAARMLEDLASFAFEKNLAKHVELGARLERSEVYLMGDQAQVAETRLRDLVPEFEKFIFDSTTPSGVRLVLRGYLSRGQIALGDAIEARDGSAKARPYWEKLSRDLSVSQDVRAAARLGLAKSAQAAGQTREAQLQMAKVVATLPTSSPVMPRALYSLGELCQELNNAPADGALYFERLINDYPNTSWANQARQKLGQ